MVVLYRIGQRVILDPMEFHRLFPEFEVRPGAIGYYATIIENAVMGAKSIEITIDGIEVNGEPGRFVVDTQCVIHESLIDGSNNSYGDNALV